MQLKEQGSLSFSVQQVKEIPVSDIIITLTGVEVMVGCKGGVEILKQSPFKYNVNIEV